MNLIFYSRIVAALTTLLMAYASYITLRASKRMEGELRVSVLLILGALLTYLLIVLLIGAYNITGNPFSSNLCAILPFFALLGSILFLIGAKKLFSVLLSV